jgi:hypothetical protein
LDGQGLPVNLPDDSNDSDYRLLFSSRCMDAGDPDYLAGPNETDLDGIRRLVGSRIDMGAYEFNYVEASLRFTPQALNPGIQGNWVKAHLVLPEGYAVEDVNSNTPVVVYPGGIESDYMNVFINEDGSVEIEAAFDRVDFCGSGPFDGTVTVSGVLTSGQHFVGTDTIKIVSNNLKYVADLASYWLQTDCGKPDWCGGADLNQDSVVNFADLALFDGCCIEVVP